MKGSEVLIKREELFELVWEKSMVQLAKEFGISDVGLAKICKRMEIPRPPVGYWAKISSGKKLLRPALKPLSQKGMSQAYIRPMPEGAKKSYKKNRVDKILVASELIEPSKLVERTLKHLRSGKLDNYNRIILPSNCLNIFVTKATVERACLIADSLIKNLEEKGYEVKLDEDKKDRVNTYVLINEEKVYFSIEEPVNRVEHKKDKDDPWWYHNRFNFVSSNKLILDIKSRLSDGARHQWKDKPSQVVENCLGDFIVALEVASIEVRKQREEMERARIRWKEEMVHAEEKRRLKEIEKQKVEKLLQEVNAWELSGKAKAYLMKLEKIEPKTDKLEQWILWLKQYIKKIDPLSNIDCIGTDGQYR